MVYKKKILYQPKGCDVRWLELESANGYSATYVEKLGRGSSYTFDKEYYKISIQEGVIRDWDLDIKSYKKILFDFIIETFGGCGKYYTDKNAEGYKTLFGDMKRELKKEGFNLCDRNVARIIDMLNGD